MGEHQQPERAADGQAGLLLDRHGADEHAKADGDGGHGERQQQQRGECRPPRHAGAHEADGGGDADEQTEGDGGGGEFQAGGERAAELRDDGAVPGERVAAGREDDEFVGEQAEIDHQPQRDEHHHAAGDDGDGGERAGERGPGRRAGSGERWGRECGCRQRPSAA
jgi:hypothetical protein